MVMVNAYRLFISNPFLLRVLLNRVVQRTDRQKQRKMQSIGHVKRVWSKVDAKQTASDNVDRIIAPKTPRHDLVIESDGIFITPARSANEKDHLYRL